TEGGSIAFTVSLSNPVDVDTTINVTFTDGTATGGGTDYTCNIIQLTFTAESTTCEGFLVPTTSDDTVEADETFTAHLAPDTPLTGVPLRDTSVTATGATLKIYTLSLHDALPILTEGGSIAFTVSLSNPVDVDTTINVTFTDGTATGGGTD